MSIVSSLEKLGLTETEATIFTFLYQNGPTRAPQLQTALGLNKVSAYRALNALITSGLVTTSGAKRVQKYEAEPLNKLMARYDHSLQEIQQAKVEFEKWSIDQIEKEGQLYKERKVQVYEGVEGFRLWYDERLKGDVKIIKEIGSNLYWREFADSATLGKNMANETMQKRLQKKIPLQSIYITTKHAKDVPPYAKTRQDYLKETRIINMPSLPTGDISIFGTRFGFYTEENGLKRGVIIDDPILVSLVNAVFETLWSYTQEI